MPPRTRTRLATLAATAALCLAPAADAAIVYYGGPEIPIPTTFAGVSIDLEGGASTNDLSGAPGADANLFLGGLAVSNDADETAFDPTWQPVRVGPANDDLIDNLAPGTTVDAGSTYGTSFGGSGNHFPPFTSGVPGYIGFSLVLDDTTLTYGWMRVTLQDDNTPGTVHEWAFQDDGSPIAVGQIPEPSAGLLALAALGTATLARRRRSE